MVKNMINTYPGKRKSFLCTLGFHKWGRPRFISQASSNILDYRKECLRCGVVKKWVETKR